MSSKKDPGPENSNKNNKINSLECLTEDLIHRILNLLTTLEETRFSTLSKRLRSSWISFPSLNFDFGLFTKGTSSSDKPTEFFNYIHRTLQLRGPYIKQHLQKLRFAYNGRHPYSLENDFETLVQMLIDFASENSVKVLEFDIRSEQSTPFSLTRGGSESFSIVLRPVFFLQCVKILKLRGFNFPDQDLELSCPLVEDFTLDTCNGIRNFRISSECRRLSKADISHCPKLGSVHVDAEHVESFSLMGTDITTGCLIDISACSNSLKDLTLGCVIVYELLQQLDEYIMLRFLSLSICNLPTTLNIGSSSLVTLKLCHCNDLENLVISSENLQSFFYHESPNATCNIDISECNALTNLELVGADVTTAWLKDTISAIVLLKKVALNNCFSLEKIEIKHNSLERVILEDFDSLQMVEIDCRNLLEFSYTGQLDPFPIVITSSKCSVIISLDARTYALDKWLRNLSKFITYFNHCRLMTLNCSSVEDLIFPREYLWYSPFPLPDMKHLIVQLLKKPGSAILVDLMESLLWIVSHPETVTIVYGNKRYLLKFHFSDEEKNEAPDCCFMRPFKCWRHSIEKVELENFEEEDRKSLETFLFAGYLG